MPTKSTTTPFQRRLRVGGMAEPRWKKTVKRALAAAGLCLGVAVGAGLTACRSVPPASQPSGSRPSPTTTPILADRPLPVGAPIRLGQSAPLSGPAAALGQEFSRGASQVFRQVNQAGGVYGRPIRLVQLDDGYEPQRTVANVTRLVEQDQVFALFGAVGTPTTQAILPLLQQWQLPLIAPVTGANALRTPATQGLLFHLRASYRDEAEAIVTYLVRAGWTRIALATQNDGFGRDVLESLRTALVRRGLQPVAAVSVERNSERTGRQADLLARSQPDAVVVVSAYATVASLVRELHARQSYPQIMTVSFVGTSGLQQALPRGQAHGIGITQVVPFPWDPWQPQVRAYQQAMHQGDPDAPLSHLSLEGYLAAQWVVEALRQAGPQLTREAFRRALSATAPPTGLVDLTFLGAHAWEP